MCTETIVCILNLLKAKAKSIPDLKEFVYYEVLSEPDLDSRVGELKAAVRFVAELFEKSMLATIQLESEKFR